MVSDLPELFDPYYYRSAYPVFHSLSSDEARDHYMRVGINEGQIGCAAQLRENFLGLIDLNLSTLEIGPLTSPALRGPNVFYFDVADKEALLIRAQQANHPAVDAPEIHFVSATADMGVIDRQFDQVFSSHCIEHQPDLIAHLKAVSAVLDSKGRGRFYLLIPDKRFCFDHFIPQSMLADVVGAHVDGLSLHTSSSIIRTLCMTTHNDPVRHWAGDHGTPTVKRTPSLIKAGYDLATDVHGTYYDCHAWQFTPDSFCEIISDLNMMGLIDMEIERVYQTPLNRFEFAAVLHKHKPIESAT